MSGGAQMHRPCTHVAGAACSCTGLQSFKQDLLAYVLCVRPDWESIA